MLSLKAVFRFHFLFFYRAGTSLDRNLMSTHHVEMCFFLAPAWGSFNPHASSASSVPPTCQRRVSGQICETHRLSRSASSSHYSPKLRSTMQARNSSTHERASCVTQLGRLTPKGKSSLITAMISLSSPNGEVATVAWPALATCTTASLHDTTCSGLPHRP